MKSLLRKPRSDSALNRLPKDRQEALVEFAATHSLAQTADWLRKDGVTVPRLGSLSQWLLVQRLRQQLRLNAAAVQTILQNLQASDPEGHKWDPELVQRAGQAFFSAMAVQQQNPNIWNMTQRLALLKEELSFEQSKFKESLRSKLRLGLDVIAEAFRENPQAMKLYEQACALIDAEVK